uniref:Dynein_C domain-containing protein n=1 Tax=Gongylonema pulchrum TaxID=637853 RepID=A0A183DU98_9BILA
LFRFFEREVNHGIHLLADVRSDLMEVHEVCKGAQKQSNHTRALTSALNKGLVPTDWLRYTVPKGVTVMTWIHDFIERVRQLIRLAASPSLKSNQWSLEELHMRIEVGVAEDRPDTFKIEAYITATRQTVAQSNQWSLEELHMRIEVGVAEDRPDTFKIEGLRLMGAACKKGNTLEVVDEVSTDLESVALTWVREASPTNSITLPVYLYQDRKNLLFTLDFDPAAIERTTFYERSVAVASNHSMS